MGGRRWERGSRRARTLLAIGGIAALPSIGARQATAQEWSWPERAENLTELPERFPPERLRAVMVGFTQALGVRCSYCHVGEEGAPLSTYDFPSDANPNKDRARAMYRLLGAVNDHLGEIEPSGEEVNMWCHTCHAGRPRPQTLDEALGERLRSAGGDAAIDYFLSLRERYYGGPAYDFRVGAVADVVRAFAEAGEATASIRLAEINAGHFPGTWQAEEALGDAHLAAGDTARAVAAFERALARDPGIQRIARKLGSLH